MVPRIHYCFKELQDCFHHLEKTLKHTTTSLVLKFFLPAGNNPVVFRKSTEHVKPLFITLSKETIVRFF